MPVSFLEQFEAVARRLFRRRLLAASCWLFAATAAAGLALIAIDYFGGVYEVSGRLALSLALLISVIVAWRRVRRGIGKPPTPLAVALALEDCYPEHRSLLSSGVEFSGQEDSDPMAGSADLRRAVVLRAAVAAESIDIHAIVPRKPLRRAAVAALASITLLGMVAAVAPKVLTAGFVRLANPLSDVDYPGKHDLEFRELPKLVPVGGDFVATLVDQHGRLPATTQVIFRTRRDGRWYYDSQEYRNVDGDRATVRWPAVRESFEVRAVGGDDRVMPWRRIAVAPAPKIEQLTVAIKPPAYTGLPVEDGAEPIEMLAGSRLEIDGRVDQPVITAELHSEDAPPVELVVGADGQSLHTPPEDWSPQQSGEWTLWLRTAQGMTAAADRRLRVEVVPDEPPTIEVIEPVHDLTLLPEAVVDFQLLADDDLAVRTAGITIRPRSAHDSSTAVGSESEHHIELYRREGGPSPGQVELDYSFAISALALSAGAECFVTAQSEDYAGQIGQSLRPLCLRIISSEEFLRLIDEQMARLSRVLRQAVEQQHSAAERVAQWQGTPQRLPTPEEAARLAQRQRQVREAVAGQRDSAMQLAQSVLEEYQRNRWPDVDAAARVDRLLQQLSSLAEQQLPSIETRITSFNRSIREDATAALSPAQLNRLQDVQDRQQQALAALESAYRDLAQWSDVQQFRRDVARLQRRQDALLEKTAELARQSLAQQADASDELDRQGSQAADEQRELAAQLGSALQRGREAARELSETQPQDAAALQAALAQAEQGEAQAQARAAADHLRSRRFGQAVESQRQASEQMQELLDRMTAGNGLLDRLEAALKQLAAAQLEVVAELRRLGTAIDDDNRATDSTRNDVAAIEHRQATIRERTAHEAAEIPLFPVFARMLQNAADTMREVEAELADKGASEISAALAKRAHDELRRLAEAVHEQGQTRLSPSPSNDAKQRGGEQRAQASPEQLQAMQLTLAQLGVLRQLQADLKNRTEELEKQAASHATEREELDKQSKKLAEQQRILSEMAEELRDAAAKLPTPTEEDQAE